MKFLCRGAVTVFRVKLDQDVTESEIVNAHPDSIVIFRVTQPGRFAFQWPANIKGAMPFAAEPGETVVQEFATDDGVGFFPVTSPVSF